MKTCEKCGEEYRVWNKYMTSVCGKCLAKAKKSEKKRNKLAQEFRATDAVLERRQTVYAVHSAIAAVNQEARNSGMTYGKYTALRRAGLI